MIPYRPYSEFLRDRYGEKVYKLPVNIPCSCPNRDGTRGFGGCIFCGESGSGYELRDESETVTGQLSENADYIGKRYKAKKFIAYFQSFSNTWLADEDFERYLTEAAAFPGVVGISVSTRPDCLNDEKLAFMKRLQESGTDVTVELGLQSSNDRTLQILNRCHTAAEYESAAYEVRAAGLDLCTHLITDLPWDSDEDVLKAAGMVNRFGGHVKCHSLYIEKGTALAQMYEKGEVSFLTAEDFQRRTIALLAALRPDIVIDRLVGRIPEENCIAANWNSSWWKIRDDLVAEMERSGLVQGSACDGGCGQKFML